MKLINLMNFKHIKANFAVKKSETSTNESRPPPLVSSRTLIPTGTLPRAGNCGYCQATEAYLACSVCFTVYSLMYYCNPEHQAKDWNARHKYDCKPLPKLVCAATTARHIIETAPTSKGKFVVPHIERFKAGDQVLLTHVASERVVYVRPISVSLSEVFDKLEKDIETGSETAAKLQETPEIGDTVLAPYNGRYYRAQVIDFFEPDANFNDVQCFFLDYGHSAKASWNALKKLNYKLRGIPRHTFKVILEGVNVQNSQDILNYLKSLNKQVNLEIAKEDFQGDRHLVVLKVKGAIETINDRVMQMSSSLVSCEGERAMYDVSNQDSNTENCSNKTPLCRHQILL